MSLPEPTHITPLIKDCLHGDAKAQFALYEQYHKAMYNVAWRIVKEAHEAED
ncbi:MAG: RNA polymerase subunit sigma, partial [Flavobacteriaceae bacterium]|nr:RNA polymerase subunit sigma [Flavobacteriaceae bacterium]